MNGEETFGISIRSWLIAGWFSLGLIVGVMIPLSLDGPDLLWLLLFGLAFIPPVHIGFLVYAAIDALRHGGRKAAQCLVKTTDNKTFSDRCSNDTREDGAKYEWFCADHLTVIKEAQARFLASPNRTTAWGDYEVTPNQKLSEMGATLMRIKVPREEWVPVLEGLIDWAEE